MCRYGKKCLNLHEAMGRIRSTMEQNEGQENKTEVARKNSIDNEILLPEKTGETVDPIKLNKRGERLDEPLPRPSPQAWRMYGLRIGVRKLCAAHHLGGKCLTPNCDYDHTDIDPPVLEVLRYLVRMAPCNRGPGCRRAGCYLGHMCQRHNCKGYKPCRFRHYGHYIDREVAQKVSPVKQGHEKGPTGRDEDSMEPLIIL